MTNFERLCSPADNQNARYLVPLKQVLLLQQNITYKTGCSHAAPADDLHRYLEKPICSKTDSGKQEALHKKGCPDKLLFDSGSACAVNAPLLSVHWQSLHIGYMSTASVEELHEYGPPLAPSLKSVSLLLVSCLSEFAI